MAIEIEVVKGDRFDRKLINGEGDRLYLTFTSIYGNCEKLSPEFRSRCTLQVYGKARARKCKYDLDRILDIFRMK
ncbi:MAG: hypothetical protein QNJ72_29765 [Pleurocapsa sp. MO_226.B13]|nr:hypothetical protein [Pleurocapsa sp. MO_226.B13]